MWTARKRTSADGSDWSVLADWETTKGIVRDLLSVSTATDGIRHPLQAQFADDIFFSPIVEHLLGHTAGATISDRKRAAHRSAGFMIEDGKLWRIADSAARRVARTECIPAAQGFEKALEIHAANGHFSVESTKLKISDRYFWPGMDTDCRQVMLECPRCKSFGPTTLNSLLQPIRRTQPFSLVAGDYLSLPLGKGGYKNVGLYVDVFSHHVWATKLKIAGSAKTTIESLRKIFQEFAVPEAFMADGGSHFKNHVVDEFCEANNVKHTTTPSYSPWVNGLIEGSNKILLNILRRLCAPDHDTAEGDVDPKDIPSNWPEHLDEAIRQMNDRILVALKCTPRELLFGRSFTPEILSPLTLTPTTPTDADIHFSLADSLRWSAHLRSLQRSEQQKSSFDSNAKIVEFRIGDVVQWYDSPADGNQKSVNKLAPRWSAPAQIYARSLNSFSLCDMNGSPLKNQQFIHSRRLRHFIPL
jgi:transposase InsO family protein